MAKKIITFACENSGLKAAEALADRALLKAVEIVPLPCSGKIEVGMVLKCLEEGYPGVLILGCPIDNCKYLEGNRRARKRVETIHKALSDAGVDPERVHMDFLSSVDSHKFAEIVRNMQERLAATAGKSGAEKGAKA
jgi:coenzyme F420-reducing hydrogenase delta subunit